MSDSGLNQILLVVGGVLVLLILMPLVAALLRTAADAAAAAVPPVNKPSDDPDATYLSDRCRTGRCGVARDAQRQIAVDRFRGKNGHGQRIRNVMKTKARRPTSFVRAANYLTVSAPRARRHR